MESPDDAQFQESEHPAGTGGNQTWILRQELGDEKTSLETVMTMWAGQIRIGPVGYRTPERRHRPIRNNPHQVGQCGDVVRRLHLIGRTRPCGDRLR
eukprot:4692243-Pyramimonas_sp.AAC.1